MPSNKIIKKSKVDLIIDNMFRVIDIDVDSVPNETSTGREVVDPKDIEELKIECREINRKLLGQIIGCLIRKREEGVARGLEDGPLTEELFQLAGELIDGAKELQSMSKADSDTHKPSGMSEEAIEKARESAIIAGQIDYIVRELEKRSNPKIIH